MKENCAVCPLQGRCHKSKDNRVIEINTNYRRLKEKSKAKLRSEKGIKTETTLGRCRTRIWEHKTEQGL